MKKSLAFINKTPSHTTILNWIHKIGYYELQKTKEKADDWILILDESIQFGREKLLVVFGIRASKIDFSRPLQFQDLVPLREIAQISWNGNLIKSVLLDIKKELGNIKYVVCDYGSGLKKGIKECGIKHAHDLTHKIGLVIKKICRKYPDFTDFAVKVNTMRKQLAQTKFAYILPPKLRSKCRYRNIMILSKWGVKTIQYLKKKLDDKEYLNNFGWLMKYEHLVKEYNLLSRTICEIEKRMKTNGYNERTKNDCEKLLNKLVTRTGEILRDELKKYFCAISKLLFYEDKVLISSDIIESAFGKYKNYVSSNPMAGITNLILCISAFTSSLKERDIKEALENTTINHVKNWSREFVGETLLHQRRKVYA